MMLAKKGVSNELARVRGDYFLVWTLLVLDVIGSFSIIPAVRGL